MKPRVSVRPTPQVFAKLREKLERAARENNIELVRETMDEVVAILGRALPKALPPPLPPHSHPGSAAPPVEKRSPMPPPLPRQEAPPAPTESLASRLARAFEAAKSPSPSAGGSDGETGSSPGAPTRRG